MRPEPGWHGVTMRRIALLLFIVAAAGCAKQVDRLATQRVIPRGLAVADLGQACALGESLVHPIGAATRTPDRAHKALVIAELTAGLCAETQAWEADLAGLRAAHHLQGEARAAEVLDARHAGDRAHAVAAARYDRAFAHLEAEWGPLGHDACPRIHPDDELVYLVGLVAGTLSLLHDRAGGGQVGVPLDRLGKVARAAPCLEDDRWWHAPAALQAASWATIPGSGPPDADPWALLAEAAEAGTTSGVRVARALQVLVASNAGRTDLVREGIRAHAESLSTTSRSDAFALLDEYARRVTLHQSDRLWTEAAGHRTPTLGELPGDASEGAAPFQTDPFGESDPFAPSPGEDAP